MRNSGENGKPADLGLVVERGDLKLGDRLDIRAVETVAVVVCGRAALVQQPPEHVLHMREILGVGEGRW